MSRISPLIGPAYEEIATVNWSKEKNQNWFDFMLGQDQDLVGGKEGKSTDGFVCGLENPSGGSSVHRAHFLDALVKLIPEGVAHFGKRMLDYEDDGEMVVLKFADGTTATHSAVIGCDGVKSQTRIKILGKDDPAAQPVFSGSYAYRALIPMDEAAAKLGDDAARNSHLYMGRGGHVLTFPVDHGETMNSKLSFHPLSPSPKV